MQSQAHVNTILRHVDAVTASAVKATAQPIHVGASHGGQHHKRRHHGRNSGGAAPSVGLLEAGAGQEPVVVPVQQLQLPPTQLPSAPSFPRRAEWPSEVPTTRSPRALRPTTDPVEALWSPSSQPRSRQVGKRWCFFPAALRRGCCKFWLLIPSQLQATAMIKYEAPTHVQPPPPPPLVS